MISRTMLEKKDRKIRNLDTTVILLKNFLQFRQQQSYQGFKEFENEETKKQINEMKEKYVKELEDNKTQLVKGN